MSNSPTQRTLALLRKEGWTAQVVEKWCAFSRRRIDLFGCIDVVACGKGKLLGVQTTSGSGHSSRVKKALAEPRLRAWMESGCRFEVWSWSKKGGRGERKKWTVRKEEITIGDLE